jgi:hypothetical protein
VSSPQTNGFLALADISGYSAYLASTELENSPRVLGELLELIVDHLVPPFQLSKLEGDAVLVHALDGAFSRGETLLEVIEETYASFRDGIRAIERNLCDCDACRRSPSLDLKFVVHHGTYGTHRVAGSEELIGREVALAHRLLKNGVAEETGWRGYALFSREAFDRIGLRPEGVRERTETYDLGTVDTSSLDLDARYRVLTEARRVAVEPEDADFTLARELRGPPPVVWEWLNDPARRRRWEDVVIDEEALPGGRSGTGVVTRCLRGGNVLLLTVLDWRPFDYFTVRSSPPGSEGGAVTTYRLMQTDGSTKLQVTTRLGGAPIRRRLSRHSVARQLDRSIDRLATSLAEQAAAPGGGGSIG